MLTLNSAVAWASWSAGSAPGGSGAFAATTVGAGGTPAASATVSDVSITWPAAHLATDDAVSGYRVARYTADTNHTEQTVTGSCAGLVTATSCTETGLPDGRWVYTVTPLVGTFWSGAESSASDPVATDATAPTNAITTNVLSGNAVQDGTTVYYRGLFAGSFTLTNTLTDATSGPASSTTTSPTGTTEGWSHSGSTVTAPDGGPYVSNVFSWDQATSGTVTETVTGRDVAGNSNPTELSFVDDSTGPAGASVSYPDGYQSDQSVPVSFTDGSDAAGIAGRQLQRAVADLADGTCGSFSDFTAVGPSDPTSPFTDADVTNGHCYTYRYVVIDRLGNGSVASSPHVAKLDPYAGGPDLGAAGPYSVLAGTSVVNFGATMINGNLGISPGESLTGFPPGTVTGTIDLGDAAAPAQSALNSAYADAAGRAYDGTFSGDQNGAVFGPGVYRTNAAFELDGGTMVLDAHGDPNAVFIFQVGGALTPSAGSNIGLINGAQAAHVYWQVAGAASISTSSTFMGTIMATDAITFDHGAVLNGRALSMAAVTLDDSAIN